MRFLFFLSAWHLWGATGEGLCQAKHSLSTVTVSDNSFAIRLEAVALRLEAIAIRLEAVTFFCVSHLEVA